MLAGKRIVVTGASGGIGRSIAQRAAKLGALVGVHGHTNRDASANLALELGGVSLAFDVRDGASVAR
ncbi:MAG TPA: SDR family NAD(P)-dependent oxidoreductase, partial [Polyangiaceae bacterium]|nr:SDR family NAD(P)-dependent oxidoreductase [Polyangiaceae bacterium]